MQHDIADLVRALGRKKLRRRLGVSEQAITNALAAGSFPSGWYTAVLELGSEQNVAVPLAMFRWRASESAE